MNIQSRRVVGRKDANTPQNQTPPADNKDKETIVTDADFDAKVAKAVAEGIKAAPQADPKAIAKAVREELEAERKAAEEKAKADADAKAKADAEAKQKAEFDRAVKAALESIKRQNPGVSLHAGDAGRGQVEIPYGWTKGNLYPHAKQLLNCLMMRPMNHGIDDDVLRKAVGEGDRQMDRMVDVAQRKTTLTSTGSGTGDEFVPSDLSAQIQSRMYLESELLAALLPGEIMQPTDSYIFPLDTTLPTFYKEATEDTDATESNPATSSVTMTTARLVALVKASYELVEDSIVPILSWLEGRLAKSAALTWESVILNGDTTATHQDTDTQLVAKHSDRAAKGLRKLALAIAGLKTDISSAGVTTANVNAILKLMGKYFAPSDTIIVPGPKTYITLLGLTEVLTPDKAGPAATLITGKVPSLFGCPIIRSEKQREDVDATGVNGSSGNTKATLIAFNKSQFLLGRRRDLLIETERNIVAGRYNVVASFRRSFTPVETPSASVTSCAIGYNF